MNKATPAFTCQECGALFERTPGKRGPAPKHCSRECKATARLRRESTNGVAERRRQATKTKATATRASRPTTPCPYCSTPMDNIRRKQCGADACKRKFQTDRMREWQRQHKAKTGEWYGHQARMHTCKQCGKEWESKSIAPSFCSTECAWTHVHGPTRKTKKKQTRAERALKRLAKAAAGESGKGRIAAGRCLRCGQTFLLRVFDDLPAYCSSRCKRRYKAFRRRALTAGVKVAPVRRWAIYERDGWICHICGDPVNRESVFPELDCAVLDHVESLAGGGAHSEDNLKTAHFYCNSVKRELPLHEVS